MRFVVTAESEDGREGEKVPIDAATAEDAMRLYRQSRETPYPIVSAA